MNLRPYLVPVFLAVALAGLAGAAWLTRDYWQAWSLPDGQRSATAEKEEGHGHAHGGPERVKLSPQARANLRLVVNPIQPQKFRRHISASRHRHRAADQGGSRVRRPSYRRRAVPGHPAGRHGPAGR